MILFLLIIPARSEYPRQVKELTLKRIYFAENVISLNKPM